MIIEYDPRKETTTVNGLCEKCDNKWIVSRDNSVYQLPMELKEKCPKCGHVNILFYPDEEMNKQMMNQKYVLDLPLKFENAKKTIEKLKEERDALKVRNTELFDENKILVKAIDILTAKLEKLNIKLDGGTENPLAK